MRRLLLSCSLLAALVAVVPAEAHHGWSGYEAEKTLTLTGTVQTVRYENPHVTLQLESEGKSWTATLAPVSRMQRRGLADGFVKPGDTVTVEGHASLTNPAEMKAERILVDGTTTGLR